MYLLVARSGKYDRVLSVPSTIPQLLRNKTQYLSPEVIRSGKRFFIKNVTNSGLYRLGISERLEFILKEVSSGKDACNSNSFRIRRME